MKCPLFPSPSHQMVVKAELSQVGAIVWYCPQCKQTFWVRGTETKPIEPYVVSYPPEGYRQVLNLYVDPATGKLIVRWDDEAL